jgi:hypothetical protein
LKTNLPGKFQVLKATSVKTAVFLYVAPSSRQIVTAISNELTVSVIIHHPSGTGIKRLRNVGHYLPTRRRYISEVTYLHTDIPVT